MLKVIITAPVAAQTIDPGMTRDRRAAGTVELGQKCALGRERRHRIGMIDARQEVQDEKKKH